MGALWMLPGSRECGYVMLNSRWRHVHTGSSSSIKTNLFVHLAGLATESYGAIVVCCQDRL